MSNGPQDWQLEDRFLYYHTRWVSFYGEHYTDSEGSRLEYYRVEKAPSVIVLPVQEGRIYAAPWQYRAGVGRATLDFPGGRVDEEAGVEVSARSILQRELGVPPNEVEIELFYENGLLLNSAFSDQKLYAAAARISPSFTIAEEQTGGMWPLDGDGLSRLLGELECAQCRLALLEYLRRSGL
jgi:ADP-ribose pyrophosphatase YjhB (NUDIX family)